MKFINNNGLEVELNPGAASVKGVKPGGDEVVVNFSDEPAQSIDFLLNLDIYELEKLWIRDNSPVSGA